jgi:hypothetical protein
LEDLEAIPAEGCGEPGDFILLKLGSRKFCRKIPSIEGEPERNIEAVL